MQQKITWHTLNFNPPLKNKYLEMASNLKLLLKIQKKITGSKCFSYHSTNILLKSENSFFYILSLFKFYMSLSLFFILFMINLPVTKNGYQCENTVATAFSKKIRRKKFPEKTI